MTESQKTAAATLATVKPPSKARKAATPKTKSILKKAASTHPPTAQMVNNAIAKLKERGGSSLQVIKKYISSTYIVDDEKIAPFIRKYLKSAVDNGSLIRTKGKGARGSFKLAIVKAENTKKKSAVKKTKAAAPSKKTPTPKKAKVVKAAKKAKSPAKPKPAKTKSAALKKTPSTAKNVTKVPAAKKPKSPKPKKAVQKATKKPATKK